MSTINIQKVIMIVFIGFYGFILGDNLLARGIFLNGVDISSSKNQTLNNVNINISEDGTIFIEAPQYQVKEDNIFTPLGKTSQGRFYNDRKERKEGSTHTNSLVDPKSLPRYSEFRKQQSTEIKARKVREQDTSADEDSDEVISSGKSNRVKNKGNLIRQKKLEEQQN